MFDLKPYCHYCKKTDCLLVSLHAPGIYYICDDCIKKQEARDNTIAVLFYSSGLKFVSHEEAARLELESTQQGMEPTHSNVGDLPAVANQSESDSPA